MYHSSIYYQIMKESGDKPEPGQKDFMRRDAPYREKDKDTNANKNNASKNSDLFKEINII